MLQLTTGLPLLFALGARLAVNALVPDLDHPPAASDFLLNGLFQGVLIHETHTQYPPLVFAIVFGVAAKLVIDYARLSDTLQSACTVVGVALGVLATDLLSQTFDQVAATPVERERTTSHSKVDPRAHEPPAKRIRLVSFGRDRTRSHRHRDGGREHAHRDRDRHEPRDDEHEHTRRDGDQLDEERNPRRLEVRAITPTLTFCSTAPSISLDSVPSSIDPEGKLGPAEREVAVLRARASLADSERRRFKEERKWALSQGNAARASQLAWQVKRYTALMESFHREADAKVVEGASVLNLRA